MRIEISLKKIIKYSVLTFYALFILALIAGNIVSGIYTLLPTSIIGWGATKTNYLGYVSHCSFAPWSTLISIVFVVVGVFLFIKLVKKLRPSINESTIREYLVSIILLILFIGFPVIFIAVYMAHRIFKHYKPGYAKKIAAVYNNILENNIETK